MILLNEAKVLRALIDTFIPTGVFFVVFHYLAQYIYNKLSKNNRIVLKIFIFNIITISFAFIRLLLAEYIEDRFNFNVIFIEYYISLPIYKIISSFLLYYCNLCSNSLRYIDIGNLLLITLTLSQIVALILFFKLIFKNIFYSKVIDFIIASVISYFAALVTLISLHAFVSVFFA